jgi:hypothetical protein
MTRYLMYKNKLNNMEDKKLPTINSSEDGIKMPGLG